MGSDNLWGEIILIGLALLLRGACHGAEVALLTAQKSRLQEWQEDGRPGAADALLMYETPERFRLTIQVAMIFTGVFAAAVAGAVAVQQVVPWLTAQWSASGFVAWAPVLTVALAICLLTYVTLIVGQLVPRAVALQHPEWVLCLVARPFRRLTRLSGAVRAALMISVRCVLWVLRQRPPSEESSLMTITEETVTTMVREGADRGIFEEVEHELIEGVFEFTDTAAREVMVPRVHIQALDITTSPEDVLHKMSHIGHSRVPIFSGDLDHIVGVLYFKDLLRAISDGTSWSLYGLLHQPLFVPETVQISQLLRTLQQQRLNMAIAIDEHGGVAGLVTMEDLIEQLVGEIGDEDEAERDPQVINLPDGAMVVRGSIPLWELRERYALPVEESSDYQTIAGLLLARLGRIPQGGEAIIERGYRFTVVDMEGPRIARVRIEPSLSEDKNAWAADMPLDEAERPEDTHGEAG